MRERSNTGQNTKLVQIIVWVVCCHYQLDIGWPHLGSRPRWVVNAGQIICQGVEPHVHDVLGVAGQRDAYQLGLVLLWARLKIKKDEKANGECGLRH